MRSHWVSCTVTPPGTSQPVWVFLLPGLLLGLEPKDPQYSQSLPLLPDSLCWCLGAELSPGKGQGLHRHNVPLTSHTLTWPLLLHILNTRIAVPKAHSCTHRETHTLLPNNQDIQCLWFEELSVGEAPRSPSLPHERESVLSCLTEGGHTVQS